MNTNNRWLTIIVACFFLLCLAAVGTGSIAIAKASAADILQTKEAQTIPYSGLLTSPDGKAVADGRYDFTFSLYDAVENGNLLWTETQSGVAVASGDFITTLGQETSLPQSVFNNKEVWIEVSVRGPDERAFTRLTPRQMISTDAPAETDALTCPHSHFTDYWSGTSSSFGVEIDQTGTGDGIRAFSNATAFNYGAIYAYNLATSGLGRGVYAGSYYGTGIYAESFNNDGLEATTTAALANRKSAIFAHTNSGYGVYATSGAAGSPYPNEYRAIQGTGTGTNNLGAWLLSTQNAGAIIQTNVPGSYVGLLIDGDLNIINGGCTGCVLAYNGMNAGTEDIRNGDLVALVGVEVDAATQQPIIQVKRASSETDIIIGVSIGPAADPSDPTRTSPETSGKSGPGVTAQGEYVKIVISGLAQVRVDGTSVSIGSRLTAGRNSAVEAAETGNFVARAMSEVDADGFVWALIDGR
jgi:hypothetical protein